MKRYHDVIASFGGESSYDADNRPLLVMRSNLWASGYDVDGTDQTSLGQFSGRVQQTYKHSVPRFFVFFFSRRRRHTSFDCDWSSAVCSSDLHAAVDLKAVNPLVLSADRDAPERSQRGQGTERRQDAQVPSRVRQTGELRLGDDVRGPAASSVQLRVQTRADGQCLELDDRGLEHEIGAVALAEDEDDARPTDRSEPQGPRVDEVGTAGLDILQKVSTRRVGRVMPMRAAGCQGRRDNGAVDRRPVALDDASLKRRGCDPLRAEWPRGQAERQHAHRERSRAWAHPLGRSNAWNRGYSRSAAKLGSMCALRKRTW